MYDAPIAERIIAPRMRLPLYTADDLREVETACKRQCRDEWWGATVIGFLGGLLFSAFAVAVLSF